MSFDADTDDAHWPSLPGWISAYKGLKLYFWALIGYVSFIVLIAIVGVFVAMGAAQDMLSSGGSMAAMDSVLNISRAGAIGGLMFQLVFFVGLYRYMNVPEQSGAQAMARAAFALALIGTALGLYTTVDTLFLTTGMEELIAKSEEGGVDILGLVGMAVNLGMLGSFILSMATTAHFIGEWKTEARARTTLVLLVVVFAAMLLMTLIIQSAPQPGLLAAFGAIGIGIWALVYYLMVMFQLSTAIAKSVDVTRAFD